MSVNQDFKDLFRILKDCEVRYLVAGAYAVIYHTEPRYTKDLDIWVEPTPENAEKVWKALKIFGAPLRDISVKNFCDKELVYQIGVAPNRIDVMMDIPGVSFSGAWKNRVKTSYDEVPTNIMAIEDLIQAKETSNRDQDRLDLRNLELKRESKL